MRTSKWEWSIAITFSCGWWMVGIDIEDCGERDEISDGKYKFHDWNVWFHFLPLFALVLSITKDVTWKSA